MVILLEISVLVCIMTHFKHLQKDNIQIWLFTMISMIALNKASWSSSCCWITFWRELITVAWMPEFWYVLTASSKACFGFLLLCKRKYKYSKMRIHPIEYYSEKLMEKRNAPHQLHEWLTSLYQKWMQGTFEAMKFVPLKDQYHAKVWQRT